MSRKSCIPVFHTCRVPFLPYKQKVPNKERMPRQGLKLSWFSFYATARLFLFMSLSGFSYLCHFPTLFSFSHCPHPLTSLPDFFFIYVIARLDRAIQQFIFWHLRLFFLSSAAFLSVIIRLDRIIHYFLSRFRILRSSRSMTGKKGAGV